MPLTSESLSGNDRQDREIDEPASVRTALLRRSDSEHHISPTPLIIGLQVGSGIFSVPSLIARQVGSPAEALGVFLVAGLLVWTGAASFVELGLRVPSNGGIQEYLRASWGDYTGYLFSWIWVGVVRPAGNAVISTIFADYLLRAFRPSDTILLPWTTKMVALSGVASLTIVNCCGATTGAKAANIFMVLKLAVLGSIIGIGLSIYMFGHGHGVPASDAEWFGWGRAKHSQPYFWGDILDISTAVFGALFCYGGWESAAFVIGDMENPAQDLPTVINGAMTLVITGFLLLNAGLYICLPFELVRESKAVAVEFANRTIGPWGGLIFTIAVAVSAMGAVNANIFAVTRLCVAAAQRAYFPLILANSHCCTAQDEDAYFHRTLAWPLRLPVLGLAKLTRKLRWDYSVPIFPLLLNWFLTSAFILAGSFSSLLNLIEMIKFFCYMMSVLGIFILRSRMDVPPRIGSQPTQRTYRTWTGNPIIFASVSFLLIARGAISAPLEVPTIFCIGVIALASLYRLYSSRPDGLPPPT
ncbi:amino acid/polyamine transporter I [Astrocystis sublimbata]|nr:amino acid/polyamine transporter I [Astrocystis sublimbata]